MTTLLMHDSIKDIKITFSESLDHEQFFEITIIDSNTNQWKNVNITIQDAKILCGYLQNILNAATATM